jgi:hypothetical protein
MVDMSTDIDRLLYRRLRTMQALAKSVNLLLQVKIHSLDGNEELTSFINYIEQRIPESYRAVPNESPFQAFYIGQNFIILVSEFEGFLVDVMKSIFRKHPKKLGSETFKLSEILELQDLDAVAEVAADRFLNAVMYKKANEYRKALVEVISADDDFLNEKWPRYVECKARRDIGIHNDWIINDTYKRKVQEVGLVVSTIGYFPPSNEYFWEALQLLAELANDIAEHCNRKFSA